MKKIEWNLPEERRFRRHFISWFLSQNENAKVQRYVHFEYINIRLNVRDAERFHYKHTLSYYATH